MLTAQRAGWRGRVRVTSHLPDGTERLLLDTENLITDDGLDQLATALRSSAANAGRLRYLAWGDDTTPPVAGDSDLGNELGRVQVTSSVAGATGVVVTTTYLSSTVIASIEELGWYGGPLASSTPGSGTLMARVLFSHEKIAGESLQIERTDTLTRAV